MRKLIYVLVALMAFSWVPAYSQAGPIEVQEFGAEAIGDGFIRSVMRAAREDGMNARQRTRLRMGLLAFPQIRQHVEAKLYHEGRIEGVFNANGQFDSAAIDWDKLIPILKELLPLILEWIKLLIGFFPSGELSGVVFEAPVITEVGYYQTVHASAFAYTDVSTVAPAATYIDARPRRVVSRSAVRRPLLRRGIVTRAAVRQR